MTIRDDENEIKDDKAIEEKGSRFISVI